MQETTTTGQRYPAALVGVAGHKKTGPYTYYTQYPGIGLQSPRVMGGFRNGIYRKIVEGINPKTGVEQSDTTYYVPGDVPWFTDYRGLKTRNPEHRLYQEGIVTTPPNFYQEMKADYEKPTLWENIGNFFTVTAPNYLNIMSGGHR